MEVLQIKPKLVLGRDALQYLKEIKQQRVFLVCDPFIVQSGLVDQVVTPLAGNEVHIFSDIVPDPPIDLVVKGVKTMMDFNPQVVIAVGGGSAIDAAKAMKHFAAQMGQGKDFMFIAVPTTSGTGSEVTSFAVITDPQKGIKYPLVSDALLPDVAILAVDMVKSVPPAVVADTGMDVLTHAIEAYVSQKANDFSDALAEKAVCLVFKYLQASYQNHNDLEAKERMHYASCLAGLAFNITSLGLNHAMAHVIGGKLHVPHGRTNAMLLPHIVEYNADLRSYSDHHYSLAAEKYAHLAKLIGSGGSNVRIGVRNLINEICKLEKTLNIPTRLNQCNLDAEQVQAAKNDIARLALEDACYLTNPRTATINDVSSIFHKIV